MPDSLEGQTRPPGLLTGPAVALWCATSVRAQVLVCPLMVCGQTAGKGMELPLKEHRLAIDRRRGSAEMGITTERRAQDAATVLGEDPDFRADRSRA
jgi:hypothetical protein